MATYIPEFGQYGKQRITIRHLLTHVSGLRGDLDMALEFQGAAAAIRLASEEVPVAAPGARLIYSDINFFLLGELVARISGEGLDAFARTHIFEPLGMRETTFLPAASLRPRIAPTEPCAPLAWPCGGPPELMMRGVVHDPTARRMGGVAGHAGLFSTAADLSRFCHGKMVEWKDATIHIASHVVHYGSGVFEGARCYDTLRRPGLFPPRRAHAPPDGLGPDLPHGAGLRPADADRRGARGHPVQTGSRRATSGHSSIAATTRSASTRCPVRWTSRSWCGSGRRYFTKEAIEEGIDVKISTWARNAPNTTPAMAKSVANYANAQLIKLEAMEEGYAEGIALDTQGNLSEGSGQNVFVVRDGMIYTTPVGNSVLAGITRDSVMTLARAQGFEVREQVLPRELLYIADEVFFVGTAVEVTPIKSVDRVKVGRGRRGPGDGSPAAAVLPDREGRGAGYLRLAAAVDAPAAAR